MDLLPYLTELPPECTLLFEERKYFTGSHEKSLHDELVNYKAGAPGQKSLFARFLSGDGACFRLEGTVDFEPQGMDDTNATIQRVGYDFIGGVAAIEGPPGTGKTYTLARIIQAMRCRDLKVAATAPSHQVLKSMESELGELGVETYRICPKKKTTLKGGLKSGCGVVLGTTHQFCKPEARSQFHMLCVDEAGQLPLGRLPPGQLPLSRLDASSGGADTSVGGNAASGAAAGDSNTGVGCISETIARCPAFP